MFVCVNNCMDKFISVKHASIILCLFSFIFCPIRLRHPPPHHLGSLQRFLRPPPHHHHLGSLRSFLRHQNHPRRSLLPPRLRNQRRILRHQNHPIHPRSSYHRNRLNPPIQCFRRCSLNLHHRPNPHCRCHRNRLHPPGHCFHLRSHYCRLHHCPPSRQCRTQIRR